MADAVVLLAVVFLAIASLSDSILEALHLFFPCFDGSFTIIVLTVDASAQAGVAGDTSLATDTVQLATLASLAMTSLIGFILRIDDDIRLSQWR